MRYMSHLQIPACTTASAGSGLLTLIRVNGGRTTFLLFRWPKSRVRCPLIPRRASRWRSRAIAGPSADDTDHVILVVDDDSAVRNSLKFMIEVEGFEVDACATPLFFCPKWADQ